MEPSVLSPNADVDDVGGVGTGPVLFFMTVEFIGGAAATTVVKFDDGISTFNMGSTLANAASAALYYYLKENERERERGEGGMSERESEIQYNPYFCQHRPDQLRVLFSIVFFPPRNPWRQLHRDFPVQSVKQICE